MTKVSYYLLSSDFSFIDLNVNSVTFMVSRKEM